MRNDLLAGVLILLLVLKLYRLCRHSNLQKLLFHNSLVLPARSPRRLKPKSEKDFTHCQAHKSLNRSALAPHSPTPKPSHSATLRGLRGT
jgi:hypothetical protein